MIKNYVAAWSSNQARRMRIQSVVLTTKGGHCKSENGATKLTVSAWLLETGDPAPRGDLGIFDGSFSPQSDEGAHRGES